MIIDKVLVIASAVIKNTEGKILLVQRSNKSSFPSHWQLVEGKLEEGESITGALTREVKEEIGGSVVEMEIKTTFYNALEVKGLKYLAFRVVFFVKLESEAIVLSHEHKAFSWYTKDEALTLPLLPGIKEVLELVG